MKNPDQCHWYALCTNKAVGTTTHPILKTVAICRRCADKHELPVSRFDTEFDIRNFNVAKLYRVGEKWGVAKWDARIDGWMHVSFHRTEAAALKRRSALWRAHAKGQGIPMRNMRDFDRL